MKKVIFILILLLSTVFLWLFILPLQVTSWPEIKRGNTLIENIENYRSNKGEFPRNYDWETLYSIGFTEHEMDTAYPDYHLVNDSTYELIFTRGFDGPYLMWNSKERVWKEGFSTMPDN